MTADPQACRYHHSTVSVFKKQPCADSGHWGRMCRPWRHWSCFFLCKTIIVSASSVYGCDFCGVDIKAFWTKELFGIFLVCQVTQWCLLGHYHFLPQVSFVLFSLRIRREMLLLTHPGWKVPATWFGWPLEFILVTKEPLAMQHCHAIQSQLRHCIFCPWIFPWKLN